MILDLIVSKNLARRQLNAGQKAGVALAYEEFYSAAIKTEEQIRRANRGGPEAAARRISNETNRALGRTDPTKSTPEMSVPRTAASSAAKVTGASPTAVKQMKALRRDTPDLYEKVNSGQVALDAAYKQRRQRVAPVPGTATALPDSAGRAVSWVSRRVSKTITVLVDADFG